LKFKLSPTLYPLPALRISNPVIPPFVTDSTSEICLMISFDSTKKSLLAYSSLTLYPKVFLARFELLKLND